MEVVRDEEVVGGVEEVEQEEEGRKEGRRTWEAAVGAKPTSVLPRLGSARLS